eukprot:1882900-Pyramimonas_sp.AAC.1
MLSLMQLRFEGGVLFVSAELQGNDGIANDIANILQHCFKMHAWTESRWLSVGTTAREFVVAEMLGIEDLVDVALRRGVSDWRLKSLVKVSPRMKEFMMAAAVGARPADSCIASLLKDDRLPFVLPEHFQMA